MLYPCNNVNKFINRIAWVTQKNIEAEESKAQKKEEPKEKLRKSSIFNRQFCLFKSIAHIL